MEKRLWIKNWGPSKDRGHHETRDAQGHLNIKGRVEKEELQLEMVRDRKRTKEEDNGVPDAKTGERTCRKNKRVQCCNR